MTGPKFIVIDGISFCRDDETGYYLNGTMGVRAHRYVYAKYHGPIPEGYHVHHKDEDKSNNDIDNLELMLAGDHLTYHGLKNAANPEWLEWSRNNMATKARPAASEWHGSEAGLAWHREHAKCSIMAIEPRDFVCEQCGTGFRTRPTGQNKFCSNACKSAHRRVLAVDHVSRDCAFCGEAFARDKYRKTRTCSRSCTNRLRAREKRMVAIPHQEIFAQ